jgi:predicted kinase
MTKPFVITFAGPPGTSKSPIALYLSHTLRLPVIQMDAIRMEVREDLSIDDPADPRVRGEFIKRAHERYRLLLKEGVSFIDDSSADRSWKQKPDDQFYQLQEHGYGYFIISMDLSKDCIARLHGANRSLARGMADDYFADHQEFLRLYGDDVGVSVTDGTFLDRMAVCERAVRQFLQPV